MTNKNWLQEQLKTSSTYHLLKMYHESGKSKKRILAFAFLLPLIAVILFGLVKPALDKRERAISEYNQVVLTYNKFFQEVAPSYPSVPKKIALLQSKEVLIDLARTVGISLTGEVLEDKGVLLEGDNLSFQAVSKWLEKLARSNIAISEYQITKTGNGFVNIQIVAY